MICPHPGLQWKRAAAALSQAGQSGSANTRHPASRPHTPPADQMYVTDVRQTDVRQHHCLMPPRVGHNNIKHVKNFNIPRGVNNKKTGGLIVLVIKQQQ